MRRATDTQTHIHTYKDEWAGTYTDTDTHILTQKHRHAQLITSASPVNLPSTRVHAQFCYDSIPNRTIPHTLPHHPITLSPHQPHQPPSATGVTTPSSRRAHSCSAFACTIDLCMRAYPNPDSRLSDVTNPRVRVLLNGCTKDKHAAELLPVGLYRRALHSHPSNTAAGRDELAPERTIKKR
jgi:hypothetical protein